MDKTEAALLPLPRWYNLPFFTPKRKTIASLFFLRLYLLIKNEIAKEGGWLLGR